MLRRSPYTKRSLSPTKTHMIEKAHISAGLRNTIFTPKNKNKLTGGEKGPLSVRFEGVVFLCSIGSRGRRGFLQVFSGFKSHLDPFSIETCQRHVSRPVFVQVFIVAVACLLLGSERQVQRVLPGTRTSPGDFLLRMLTTSDIKSVLKGSLQYYAYLLL